VWGSKSAGISLARRTLIRAGSSGTAEDRVLRPFRLEEAGYIGVSAGAAIPK
jgi:hypothetical protein